uniref:Uncharacterized protein n=1 Tax=Biomphalaria glabrata TaxID=6526 RepID=A0A2C9LY81_BIOGL
MRTMCNHVKKENNKMIIISLLLTFSLCYFGPVTGQRGLSVNIITNGSYSLSVNGVTWLTSGNTFFNNGGRQYSTADKSLSLLNSTTTSGSDGVGQWQSTSFNYQAGSLPVTASIKTYNMPDLPLVIFSQTYTGSANRTADNDSDHVISSFPSFKTFPGSPTDLGYLAYGGYHSGYSGLSMGRQVNTFVDNFRGRERLQCCMSAFSSNICIF